MRAINTAAEEPYKTYYWILAETGMRAGEIGALTVGNVLLDQGIIKISQSVWHGKIQTVKSKKGNRICEISEQLVRHLRGYIFRTESVIYHIVNKSCSLFLGWVRARRRWPKVTWTCSAIRSTMR